MITSALRNGGHFEFWLKISILSNYIYILPNFNDSTNDFLHFDILHDHIYNILILDDLSFTKKKRPF